MTLRKKGKLMSPCGVTVHDVLHQEVIRSELDGVTPSSVIRKEHREQRMSLCRCLAVHEKMCVNCLQELKSRPPKRLVGDCLMGPEWANLVNIQLDQRVADFISDW